MDIRNSSRYSLEFNILSCLLVDQQIRLTGTLGLLSVLGEHFLSDSSVLIFASTHLLARPVGPDIIILNFPTEMFEQAMKQAMMNWTNSLASTVNNTVKGVDAGKIVQQFNHHASQPMVFNIKHRLRQAVINIMHRLRSRWLVSNHG